MKQYLTPDQTAKLIDLGFKPESIKFASDCEVVNEYGIERIECTNPQFSIGELIEMLPKIYDSEGLSIGWHYTVDEWVVQYPKKILTRKEELVDALYDVVVKLKEEGVI